MTSGEPNYQCKCGKWNPVNVVCSHDISVHDMDRAGTAIMEAKYLKIKDQLADAENVLDSFEKTIRDGSDARLYQDQIKALDDLDFYRIKYPKPAG